MSDSKPSAPAPNQSGAYRQDQDFPEIESVDAAPAAPVPASGQAELDGAIATQPPLDVLTALEALLFVAPGSVPPAQLAAALELPLAEVEHSLDVLDQLYQGSSPPRGLRVQRFRGRVQLITTPAAAPVVERFLGLEASSRLSRAALETLAIILYRQPVTRPQIDAVRGVNSDGVLKSLLFKGLVQEVGRAEAPGRPILYSATAECLQYFGLASLADLPPLDLNL